MLVNVFQKKGKFMQCRTRSECIRFNKAQARYCMLMGLYIALLCSATLIGGVIGSTLLHPTHHTFPNKKEISRQNAVGFPAVFVLHWIILLGYMRLRPEQAAQEFDAQRNGYTTIGPEAENKMTAGKYLLCLLLILVQIGSAPLGATFLRKHHAAATLACAAVGTAFVSSGVLSATCCYLMLCRKR